jgi:hypothetical protein
VFGDSDRISKIRYSVSKLRSIFQYVYNRLSGLLIDEYRRKANITRTYDDMCGLSLTDTRELQEAIKRSRSRLVLHYGTAPTERAAASER